MNCKLPTNIKRILTIGDIHGCLEELKLLLEKADFNPTTDHLIQLGDMIDRGPYSAETIKFLRSNPSTSVILGNHDFKLVKHKKRLLEGKPSYLKPDRQEIFDKLSEEEQMWLLVLPARIYYPELNMLFVHGGILPLENPLTQSFTCYIFGRYVLRASGAHKSLQPPLYTQPNDTVHWTEIYNNDINIIYGHHVHDVEKPHFVQNSNSSWTFGIDTGCCFGGKLTMAIIDVENPDQKPQIIQVDSFQPKQENPYRERKQ